MSELQQFPTLPSQPFRLDVPLHELLQQPAHKPSPDPSPLTNPKTLPTAVFPQYPELFHDLDGQGIAAQETVLQAGKRHWPASKVMKTMRGWMFPYFKSRVLPGDFQPIIAYLFTEWKCNLDCHYCWSYDNRIKGMTEDTARRHRLARNHAVPRARSDRRRAAHPPGLCSQSDLLRRQERFLGLPGDECSAPATRSYRPSCGRRHCHSQLRRGYDQGEARPSESL